jgi:hypothetical protein
MIAKLVAPSLVYAFTCDDPGLVGLSVIKNGSNLVYGPDILGRWKFSKSIPYTIAEIARIVPGVTKAMHDLAASGFHIAAISGIVLQFPTVTDRKKGR